MTPQLSQPADPRDFPGIAGSRQLPPPDWAAASDRGRKRDNNEDSWRAFSLENQLLPLEPSLSAWPLQGVLFIVSDGMGGARAGEEASRFCVDRLALELHASLAKANVDAGAAMRAAFLGTHEALILLSGSNSAWRGMGATLSALWLQPAGGLVLGHVGDSRLYGRRQGRWRQWTDDHTLGEGLVRRGGMTPEEASRFKFRSLLEQVMGGDGRAIDPQITTADWQAGDVFALCSDGLYRTLEETFEARMDAGLRSDGLSAGATLLVDAANEAGGPDNITVLLARMPGTGGS